MTAAEARRMDPIVMEPTVLAALVGAAAALVLALGGGLHAFALRQAERRARRERLEDIRTALRAEIGAAVRHLSEVDLEAHAARTLQRMAEETGFAPFVPRERTRPIFEATVGRLEILPSGALEAVTMYEAQASATAMFADDLRSDAFAGLAPDRRAAMFRDFMAMKRETLRLGLLAHRALAPAGGATGAGR